jgi:HD superfamily phosphohydrolase
MHLKTPLFPQNRSLISLFLLFCTLPLALLGKEFETFYGTVTVEEPVLIELIESPAIQRLKWIHQYGVSYYTTHHEEYTRYAHSMGVFTILRLKGASIQEQIAGLLHDVSHTIFSHVGDWIFAQKYKEEDYQSSIHLPYLQESGLEAILDKHGFKAANILPWEEFFPALEQASPNLSADRIDYNIQGAFYQDFITHQEALEILGDLVFVEGKWVSTKKELMQKLTRYSLFMTQDCWGSPTNYLSSLWLADAILRAVEIGCLTMKEVHYSTDQIVWDRLMNNPDPWIQQKMQMVLQTRQLYTLVEPQEADLIIKPKFRGIDPWIESGGMPMRLTSLNSKLAEEFKEVREVMERGWAIKLKKRQIS